MALTDENGDPIGGGPWVNTEILNRSFAIYQAMAGQLAGKNYGQLSDEDKQMVDKLKNRGHITVSADGTVEKR